MSDKNDLIFMLGELYAAKRLRELRIVELEKQIDDMADTIGALNREIDLREEEAGRAEPSTDKSTNGGAGRSGGPSPTEKAGLATGQD